ncbi:Swi3 domain-containing protein [Rhizoctonia solani AG-1 IA]|uniref:Swi3 domain-containing protein n=1 Tax=Thanatephorus cucumeris (strain AG1-IA) TaxID=983506 RepID=L8X843_THACA|nr:Swi3 domain-containing protein [Rhizoctonia solani AG-1 IA]
MDNIWDDDAVQVSRNGSSRARIVTESDEEDRPLKRARTAGASKPLFNPESDDEDNLPADVGALFDGLDDDYDLQQLPPQLNIGELQRESDQRVAVEAAKKRLMRGDVMDVSGPVDVDGKAAKARKTLPKLDENRLLDQGDGMPALVRRSKEFKVKGKGHEVALSTWRDIDKAPAPGEEDPDALMEEQDPEQDQEARHPPTSSPARITMEPGGPPMRQSQFDKEPDDDEEMWRDMMEAMETQNQEKEKEKEQGGYKQKIATSGKQPEDYGGGFDDEDWAIMDQMEEEAGKSTQPNGLGGSKIQSTLPPSSPPWTDHDVSSDAPPEPAGPSEDEDDFYAMYEP